MHYSNVYKCVFVGAENAGKTSIVNRITKDIQVVLLDYHIYPKHFLAIKNVSQSVLIYVISLWIFGILQVKSKISAKLDVENTSYLSCCNHSLRQ